MSANSIEPEVFMPKEGESNDSLIAAIDNQIEMTPNELKLYREKIDKDRVAIPRKPKKV